MTSSRHDWDLTKTYSHWRGERPEAYAYVVPLEQISDQGQPYLTYHQTEWCKQHCCHAWAWWFDAERAYIGFMDEQERMLFVMTNL